MELLSGHTKPPFDRATAIRLYMEDNPWEKSNHLLRTSTQSNRQRQDGTVRMFGT